MEHITGRTAERPTELFSFIGGQLYGPRAVNTTTRVGEKHMVLRSHHSKIAWHEDARRFYFASHKPPLKYFSPGLVHVAVHVRRGDVSHRSLPKRFLTNGLVALCVMRSLDMLKGMLHRSVGSMRVHVFSEGAPQDFGNLLQLPRASLHLNEPLMTTFHHMVMSDALVMAASTMSDVAAWLGVAHKQRVFAHPKAQGLLQYVHRDFAITSCDR